MKPGATELTVTPFAPTLGPARGQTRALRPSLPNSNGAKRPPPRSAETDDTKTMRPMPRSRMTCISPMSQALHRIRYAEYGNAARRSALFMAEQVIDVWQLFELGERPRLRDLVCGL